MACARSTIAHALSAGAAHKLLNPCNFVYGTPKALASLQVPAERCRVRIGFPEEIRARLVGGFAEAQGVLITVLQSGGQILS